MGALFCNDDKLKFHEHGIDTTVKVSIAGVRGLATSTQCQHVLDKAGFR